MIGKRADQSGATDLLVEDHRADKGQTPDEVRHHLLWAATPDHQRADTHT